MKDATLIADLVRAGVAPELIGRVVAEVTTSLSGQMSGNVRTHYLEYERLRRRNQRQIGRKQTMSAESEDQKCPDICPDTVAPLLSSPSLLSSSGVLLTAKQGSKEEVVARRGTRLPPNWVPSSADVDFAYSEGVLSRTELDKIAAEFRDYWLALPGQRGLKLNWPATWRNRVRQIVARSKENGNGRANGHGKRGVVEACDDLIDRLGAFDEPAPREIRSTSSPPPARLLPKGRG